MAWEPTLINGGLFDNTPQSNLTVPFDNAREVGNCWTAGDALYGNYGVTDMAPETWRSWSTAAGKSFDAKLKSYWVSHQGQTIQQDVILATITCKNPQGAQYYKQELVVYGSILSDPTVTTHAYWQDEAHKLEFYYAEIAITRISRREYATPTATPTVTDFVASSVAINTFVVVSGEILCEPLYSFLTSGMFCAGKVHYENKYYYGFGLYKKEYRDWDLNEPIEHKEYFTGVGLDIDMLDEAFGGSFEPEETEDPNEDPDEPGGGESEEGGGGGDQDDSEDNIPIPPLPPFGAADAGFVHMFKLTLSQMVGFATTMFSSNIWQAIKDFFSDPMDFIAGVLIVPFTPTGEQVRYPKFGSNVWPNAYPLVGNQFYEVDMGTLHCPKYYNSFLDFDAFTKIKIFLPYIGYKDLLADEVMDADIHIVYHIDVGTGDCVAFIEVTKDNYTQVCYQFQGNCAVRVPYGRQSFDAAVSSSLSLMGGVGSLAVGGAMLASGGLAGAAVGLGVAQIAGQVGSMTADAVAGQKRSMERAGSLGASAGYMGIQYPYLIREIPNQSRPSNYRKLHGYPANLGGNLGSFTGYTAVETIRLDGVACTDAEKSEIIELLRGGVIL